MLVKTLYGLYAYDEEGNPETVNRYEKQVLFFREEPNLTSTDLQNTYKKFFSHGMSDNIIEFNTFYDEGIMNA